MWKERNDHNLCPGCGRKLSDNIGKNINLHKNCRFYINGFWYCDYCAWKMNRFQSLSQAIFGLRCGICEKVNHSVWKMRYLDEMFICPNCAAQLTTGPVQPNISYEPAQKETHVEANLQEPTIEQANAQKMAPVEKPEKPAPVKKPAAPPSKELLAAAEILRKKIIEELRQRPKSYYLLGKLLWDAVPYEFRGGRNYDMAVYTLDLNTRTISVSVDTYPDARGASYSAEFGVTPEEFHKISTEKKMGAEYHAFKTQGDWDVLFDEELTRAVRTAAEAAKKEEARLAENQRKRNAIEIELKSDKAVPGMYIEEMELDLYQRYSDRHVTVTKSDNKYQVSYIWSFNTSPRRDQYSHDLTKDEAVWLEQELRAVLDNPDKTTWLSVVGTDHMSVTIRGAKELAENYSGEPSRKYTDFMDKLEKLAQYGSKMKGES